jgi:hypothetical protein
MTVYMLCKKVDDSEAGIEDLLLLVYKNGG